MPDDVGALVALGKPVTLANGEVRRLKFTNRIVAKLEKEHAGIDGYVRSLRGAALEKLAYTFSLLFGVSPDAAMDLIDGRQMMEYITAITESLVEFYGIETEACAACGERLPAEANFCSNCGTKVPEQGEVQSQETGSPSPGKDSSTSPSLSSESTRSASGTG